MRSFVLKKGKSQRFWNVYPDWRSVLTSEGKSGRGDIEQLHLGDANEAENVANRLIEEKLAEGYVETTNDPWHGGYESELRTKLEDAIVKDPEDVGAHHAYADHLIELGDPRGEFIQVQLALEDESLSASERKSLRAREKRLLAKHERSWLGPMQHFWIDKLDGLDVVVDDWGTSVEPHELTWRRGWIDSLWLHDGGVEACKAVINRAPLLRCLRDLRFLYLHDDNDSGPWELLEADIFQHVRIFQEGQESEACFSSGSIASDMMDKMPRLEEYHNYARETGEYLFLRKFASPMKKLTLHHGWGIYPLERIVDNPTLHQLSHLSCWPRAQSNDFNDEENADGGYAYISRSSAVALFECGKLNDLQHLTLRNSDIGDEGIQDLMESGFLKQLKTLDLLGGRITDVGAKLLAESPDLKNLESLNLSVNMIGEEGLEALKKTKVNLTADSQLGPDALETREYLFYGDDE